MYVHGTAITASISQPHRTDCGFERVSETAGVQLVPGLLSSPHSHATKTLAHHLSISHFNLVL